MLQRGQRRRARTAVVPGNQDHIGMSLADTCCHSTDANLSN